MKEEFLHYIWQYGLYDSKALQTTCGKAVEVLYPGRYNADAGPDFLEARLLIDKVLWIGHVEIHIRSNDWRHHGHQDDPAYDTVILHAVFEYNEEVRNSYGSIIPALLLKFNMEYFTKYLELVNEIRAIPCGTRWQDHSPVKIENAIISMGVGRMQWRMEKMSSILHENKGGMKELFIQVLSRGFGFGKNQEPMEILGRSISPVWLEKHISNLFQLESIFFGQAGFIPEIKSDTYISALRTEYAYLGRKYNMIQPAGLRWKFLRMRPGNFPAIRLAQLSSFLHEKKDFIDDILQIASIGTTDNIETHTSSYWRNHYAPGKKAASAIPEMGENSRLLIMINAILPLSAFFNKYNRMDDRLESWLEKLENLPPEENNVCRKWEESGFRIPNAFYSQSFLHIYREFCVKRKCLNCRIGHILIGKNK
jgi:hypothetical protein